MEGEEIVHVRYILNFDSPAQIEKGLILMNKLKISKFNVHSSPVQSDSVIHIPTHLRKLQLAAPITYEKLDFPPRTLLVANEAKEQTSDFFSSRRKIECRRAEKKEPLKIFFHYV